MLQNTGARQASGEAGGASLRQAGRRRWLYRVLAMTMVPAFFLCLLEGILRLCGYGYAPSFFLPRDSEPPSFVENPYFGRRFFPPALNRFALPMVLPAAKPADTYRIFILGESAALGFPDASFSFGRILQVMLEERYPDARFEVVNTAVPVITSHVILPIARECAEHQPDLFVAYMGNNEVVGPYGTSAALGFFSPSLTLVRASVWFKATRTGQLLSNAMRQASGAEPTLLRTKGKVIAVETQVAADDPRLPAIYSHCAANVRDICAAARRAQAKIVVCSVAGNLKDSAPFASHHRAHLSPTEAARWTEIYDEGIGLETAGQRAAAAASYCRALAIDAKFADLHFRLARCLTGLGEHGEAHGHYILARDLDAFRFRTDSHLNERIRTAVSGREDDGIYFADVDKAFADASPGGTVGEDLLYEHVHLTFEGNYLLARTVLEQIVRLLPDWVRPRGEPTTELLSLAGCRERLAFTEWNRYRGLSDVASMVFFQEPFTNQLDHAQRQERWQKRVLEMKNRLEAGGAQEAVAAYRRALDRNRSDFFLHKDFSTLLGEQGELDLAVQQARLALRLVSHDAILHARLAEMLALQGKVDEALAACTESLKLIPDNAEAQNIMGKLLIATREFDKAAACFSRALKISPFNPDFHTNLGKALALQSKYEQARAAYNAALRINPDFVEAHHQLGQMFNNMGRYDLCVDHFQDALRISPKNTRIRAELATVLASIALNSAKFDEAITHLEEALRLRPDWPEVAQALEKLRLKKRQKP
jgi:tetratricopeptide (TPR) repeat protein